MFKAFVIVCAASSAMEIDQSRCISFEDSWGPYHTEENCDIRINQMVDESLNTEMNYHISTLLGYPEFLYSYGYCLPLEGKSV